MSGDKNKEFLIALIISGLVLLLIIEAFVFYELGNAKGQVAVLMEQAK